MLGEAQAGVCARDVRAEEVAEGVILLEQHECAGVGHLVVLFKGDPALLG